MNHSAEYQLKETWIVCINIKENYFQDLVRMSNGNISDFLEYLFEKYKNRILHLKVVDRKGTATADYQPREKIYKKKQIEIEPSIWQKYWELRLMSGYSMSCIIRIFIEWEKLEKGEEVENLYLYPNQMRDRRLEYRYPDRFEKMNNYKLKRKWKRHNRLISFKYWDDS